MLDIIVAVIVLIFTVWSCWYNFKKCQEGIEKGIFALISLIIMVPTIMYIMDAFNVPTFFKWNNNINSQNWFSFLGTYFTGIITSVISTIALAWATYWQIRKNNEDTIKRDKENLRISNKPILNYQIDTKPKDKSDFQIITNNDNGNIYSLNIKINNIGMNSIKDIKMDVKIDSLMTIPQRILGKDTKHLLKKDGEESLNYFFYAPAEEKQYSVDIRVFYEDALSNWYAQEVNLIYNTFNIFNQSGEYVATTEYQINEEKQIDKMDINNTIL